MKETVAVVGAGTMGLGIAHVAANAGHAVLLYDVVEGAAAKAKSRLEGQLQKQVERGRIYAAAANAVLDLVRPVAALEDLKDARLVIEAIVEDEGVKRDLFARLEAIVAPSAVLATNTSSISVTAIARGMKDPKRVVGMHFFNPAPVMKLVEVISGRETSLDVVQFVFDTAQRWGKVAIHAKSTPGFIVNRVARPYYGEALRLLEEQVADPATIDALLTGAGGFQMGPFELMDLIGHDVNYAVSVSVFNAYYQEPRFRPSLLQLELVRAGHLGRKTGRGIYDYAEGGDRPLPRTEKADSRWQPVDGWVPGQEAEFDGVRVLVSDGRRARDLAEELGHPVIVCDLFESHADPKVRMGFSVSPDVPEAAIGRFVSSLAAHNVAATRLPDWPGLVLMRTLAMLANEAFETALQGVASEADIDVAVRFGVNYPKGPIEWAREIGLGRILRVLDILHALTGDPRYRASLGLRFAASEPGVARSAASHSLA